MTVYVDDMRLEATVPNGTKAVTARWSHLLADTDDELHTFARALGLRPDWAQYPDTWKSHYDVTDTMRRKALRQGAVPIQYMIDGPRLVEARREGTSFTPAPYPGKGGQQSLF